MNYKKEGRRKREDVHRRTKEETAILNANIAKQKAKKKEIVTLGKQSGERSKEGCRKETEDRRDIKKEARKEVQLKGGEKKGRGEMQRGGKMNNENKGRNEEQNR